MRQTFTFVLFFSLFGLGLSQEKDCPDDLNLLEWSAFGDPLSGDWIPNNDFTEVSQRIHFDGSPSFYLPPYNIVNAKLSGKLKIVGGIDDDHVGFTFGFKEAKDSSLTTYDCLIFDWKKVTQDDGYCIYGCKEGFALYKVNGEISQRDSSWQYFGAHKGRSDVLKIIDTAYGDGLGWQHETEYFFEMTYTNSKIIIAIDGTEIFNSEGCFSNGKFGFYTFSQQSVEFSDFFYEPFYSIEPIEDVCLGEAADIKLSSSECEDFFTEHDLISTFWDFGDDSISLSLGKLNLNPQYTYQQDGLYQISVQLQNELGCTYELFESLEVFEQPILDYQDLYQVLPNTVIPLELDPSYTYLWENDTYLSCDTCPSLNLFPPGVFEYNFEYSNQNKCTDQANIKIEVLDKPSIFIPDIFSPNKDGINDFFQIYADQSVQEIINTSVYDRWGNRVHHASNYIPNTMEGAWDGLFQGQNLKPDVFIYVIEVEYINNQTEIFSGNLTLIRN